MLPAAAVFSSHVIAASPSQYSKPSKWTPTLNGDSFAKKREYKLGSFTFQLSTDL